MKTILKIAVLPILLIVLFVKCYTCHPCVDKEDSFDLPYKSGQIVNFTNDSLLIKKFTVSTEMKLPPSEYCGPLGSESYGDCSGDQSATFIADTRSYISIKIYYNTSISDAAELPVFKNIIINNSSFVIVKNEISTSDIGGSVKALSTLTLNGKTYNDLIEYTCANDSVEVNRCVYILYSKSGGILKFSIKKTNYIENWTLDN
jgi:hypothetical protein